MSEHDADKNPAPEHDADVRVEHEPKAPVAADGKLTGLMADGAATAHRQAGKPDLEAEALRAAEAAIAEGERALAAARAQLEQQASATATNSTARARQRRKGRELALRLMLAVNVVAMIVVASLPSPVDDAPAKPTAAEHQPVPQQTAQEYNQPFNRALAAADRRDYTSAVSILEQYLQDNPRMAPGRRLTVLTALSEYTARLGNFARSQDYVRQANAIEQSHKTPEDLVADAKAAIANGDQEGLRSIWARFLLQQRQIPSWLYKHVAQAYLELGDSYRRDADAAAEIARRKELEESAMRLRNETLEQHQEHR